MSEYIYNAKRGWINVEEAYGFIQKKKIGHINDPKISVQHHLKYGDKYDVPPTSRPISRETSVQVPNSLSEEEGMNIITSLHDTFNIFRNEINKKRMSKDLVKMMVIYAKINTLIRSFDTSFRSKSFRTIPSGFTKISSSIGELGVILQQELENKNLNPRIRQDIYSIVAFMNKYIHETAKERVK